MWHVLSNDTVININVPNVKAITTSNLQQQKYLQLKISNLMHIHINQLFSWFWIKPESLSFDSSNVDSTCPNLYYNIIK